MVKQEAIIGVYKITNTETKKYYIGYSKDVIKRFKRHVDTLKTKKHQNVVLQRAYNKYGIDKFSFEIIEHCEDEIGKGVSGCGNPLYGKQRSESVTSKVFKFKSSDSYQQKETCQYKQRYLRFCNRGF